MLRKFLLLLCFLVSLNSFAGTRADRDVRMLINLMDYIAKDYQMAVKDGEVLNEFEYAEMQEFGATSEEFAIRLFGDSSKSIGLNVLVEVRALQSMISSKASVSEVSAHAAGIKQSILDMNLVAKSPENWPSMNKGKALYSAQCASCHGTYGAGDGSAGAALQPSPTNFRDKELMAGVAPLQAFNTITLGIPGTGMRAFDELSETEIWDLAFYISSLRHQDQRSAKPEIAIPLSDLASLSDVDLAQRYPDANIAAHRSNPQELQATDDTKPTSTARQLLVAALQQYEEGNTEEAEALALDAYLQGVEPIEAQIMASDNSLFKDVESVMMKLRSEMHESAPFAQVQATHVTTLETFDRVDELIGNRDRGVAATAFLALSILLREGLEAFFVILAILGIMKSVNAPSAVRWIHAGWVTAVLFGIVGWFFADILMKWSAQSRELMEGVMGLIAVVVLLYLGFWLHGKTEAAKWKEFVENRIKRLVSKNNMIGLASFSFVVVFREALESVIFLSTLTADGETSSKIGVGMGFVVSAVLLFGIAWAILRWFKRLPISKVFLYSSIVILALAFILAGEGIHAIQEGGFIDVRSFPINLRFTPLGIYPTYESLLTQLLVLLIIGLLWKLSTTKTAPAT